MSAEARVLKLAVSSVPEDDACAHCVEAIATAAELGADIVLLPEEPDTVESWASDVPVPPMTLEAHPQYRAYVAAARANRIGVIGNLHVAADAGFANTSFVLDGAGDCLGRYRKLHPACGEMIDTTPLNDDPFPIIEFEGARIALAICMDIHVPELFRIYGLKGADIVAVSSQYMDYTGDMLESLEKARAIDSQMFFALSRYVKVPYLAGMPPGYAKVIAPDGRIVASTAHRPGVVMASLDLDDLPRHWHEPHATLRDIWRQLRQPALYGDLITPNRDGDD